MLTTTQRERVLVALADDDWDEADRVIGEAQNAPPLGASDGSITGEMFATFVAMRRARTWFLECRRAYLAAWGLPTWPKSSKGSRAR